MAHKIIREFKFPLTNPQKVSLAENLAREMQKMHAAKDRLASLKKEITNDVAKCEQEIDEITEKLRQGYEFRDVECREERDDQRGEMVLIRLDTMEEAERNPMTLDQRQQSLPLPTGDFPEEESEPKLQTIDAGDITVDIETEEGEPEVWAVFNADSGKTFSGGYSSEAEAVKARETLIKKLIEDGVEVTGLEEEPGEE